MIRAYRRGIARSLMLALIAALFSGCAADEQPGDEQQTEAASAGAASVPAATLFASVDSGLNVPESVKHDPEQDVYFVTNVAEHAMHKSNNGYISRIAPDGSVVDLHFIAGGQNGVTLHAPKGTALLGPVLWVADVDAVRGFDRRTGAPAGSGDLSGDDAKFLNDIAVGPDSALYVTDTGFGPAEDGGVEPVGPFRVFRVARDGSYSIALESEELAAPNGIFWDAPNDRFIIVSLRGTNVFSWRPGDAEPIRLATGSGGYDGVARLPDGRIIISSLADGTIYALDSDGSLTPVLSDLTRPADIGVDARRGRILVPTLNENRVEIWRLAR